MRLNTHFFQQKECKSDVCTIHSYVVQIPTVNGNLAILGEGKKMCENFKNTSETQQPDQTNVSYKLYL